MEIFLLFLLSLCTFAAKPLQISQVIFQMFIIKKKLKKRVKTIFYNSFSLTQSRILLCHRASLLISKTHERVAQLY